MRAEAVIAEARSWLATPFVEQQHAKGIGCDCVGLIGGVAVELGLVPADFWHVGFRPYHGYAQRPFNAVLERGCREFLIEIAVAGPGDVVLMRYGDDPQHLGIVVPYVHGGLALVHAMNRGPQAVAEHRLGSVWRDRVVGAFRYPGID